MKQPSDEAMAVYVWFWWLPQMPGSFSLSPSSLHPEPTVRLYHKPHTYLLGLNTVWLMERWGKWRVPLLGRGTLSVPALPHNTLFPLCQLEVRTQGDFKNHILKVAVTGYQGTP